MSFLDVALFTACTMATIIIFVMKTNLEKSPVKVKSKNKKLAK